MPGLRAQSKLRLPGRYLDDEGPALPEKPIFVHPDVPFNPKLARHCAFPSLPIDYPGLGPSQIWAATERAREAAEHAYEEEDADEEEEEDDDEEEDQVKDQEEDEYDEEEDGDYDPEKCEDEVEEDDDSNDGCHRLIFSVAMHPVQTQSLVIDPTSGDYQVAKRLTGFVTKEPKALATPTLKQTDTLPSIAGTASFQPATDTEAEIEEESTRLMDNEDSFQPATDTETENEEGNPRLTDNNSCEQVVTKPRPNWLDLSDSMKYVILYDLTCNTTFTRAVKILGLTWPETSEMIDIVRQEMAKEKRYNDTLREHDPMFKKVKKGRRKKCSPDWLDEFIKIPQDPFLTDNITTQDVKVAREFLTFLGMNTLAQSLDDYRGSTGYYYHIPLDHNLEDGYTGLIPHFNNGNSKELEKCELDEKKRKTQEAKERIRYMSDIELSRRAYPPEGTVFPGHTIVRAEAAREPEIVDFTKRLDPDNHDLETVDPKTLPEDDTFRQLWQMRDLWIREDQEVKRKAHESLPPQPAYRFPLLRDIQAYSGQSEVPGPVTGQLRPANQPHESDRMDWAPIPQRSWPGRPELVHLPHGGAKRVPQARVAVPTPPAVAAIPAPQAATVVPPTPATPAARQREIKNKEGVDQHGELAKGLEFLPLDAALQESAKKFLSSYQHLLRDSPEKKPVQRIRYSFPDIDDDDDEPVVAPPDDDGDDEYTETRKRKKRAPAAPRPEKKPRTDGKRPVGRPRKVVPMVDATGSLPCIVVRGPGRPPKRPRGNVGGARGGCQSGGGGLPNCGDQSGGDRQSGGGGQIGGGQICGGDKPEPTRSGTPEPHDPAGDGILEPGSAGRGKFVVDGKIYPWPNQEPQPIPPQAPNPQQAPKVPKEPKAPIAPKAPIPKTPKTPKTSKAQAPPPPPPAAQSSPQDSEDSVPSPGTQMQEWMRQQVPQIMRGVSAYDHQQLTPAAPGLVLRRQQPEQSEVVPPAQEEPDEAEDSDEAETSDGAEDRDGAEDQDVAGDSDEAEDSDEASDSEPKVWYSAPLLARMQRERELQEELLRNPGALPPPRPCGVRAPRPLRRQFV